MEDDKWAHDILVLIELSNMECSDESAQMRRLARAFAACIHKVDEGSDQNFDL